LCISALEGADLVPKHVGGFIITIQLYMLRVHLLVSKLKT